MKDLAFIKRIQKFGIFILTFFFSVLAFAQEATGTPQVNVTTTKTVRTEEWFTNPLYWVVGALLLIILIAVIARGNKRD